MNSFSRLSFTLTLGLAFSLSLLNIGARAVGSTQPIHPALAGLVKGCDDIPQPCWYGIVPGVTAAEEQNRMMLDYGYTPIDNLGFVTSYRSPIVSQHECQQVMVMRTQDRTGQIIVYEIILSECATVQSGHLMMMFSMPSISSIRIPIYLYNKGGVRTVFDPAARWNKTPFEGVRNIRLRARGGTLLQNWHGFVPLWRYCQLEPTVQGCE